MGSVTEASLRLFVALPCGPEAVEAVGAWQAELRRLVAGVSWVRPENFHVTLRFLGEVAESRLDRVKGAVRGAASEGVPFELALRGAGCFPRVLWVGVEAGPPESPADRTGVDGRGSGATSGPPADPPASSPASSTAASSLGVRGVRDDPLHGLAAGLERSLAASGFGRADRAFRPHLTIGRLRDAAARVPLRTLAAERQGAEWGRWHAREVILMRSQLDPRGAIYTPLLRAPLGRVSVD